jgi:glycopeptide antibiotics resistance protein
MSHRVSIVAPLTALYAVGVSRDVSSIADTHALPALVVLLVAAALLTWWLRRSGRTDRAFGAVFASLASICLIVAVTLMRSGWPEQFSVDRLTDWSTAGFERLRSDPFGSSQFILNVALFVPAGVTWTWMTRRPAAVAGALVGVSILIESVQALTGLGAPDVADLVANSIGGLVGVGTATLLARATRHRAEATLSPRKRAMVAASALGLGAVALTLVLVGADRHQQSLRHELQTAFAGTTKADVDRWNADGTILQEVFDAVSVFADGAQYSPDEVKVRYPASFLGVHRCVFAIWTATSVRFEGGSGDACTDSIG